MKYLGYINGWEGFGIFHNPVPEEYKIAKEKGYKWHESKVNSHTYRYECKELDCCYLADSSD